MKRRLPAHPVITLVDPSGYFILGLAQGFLIIYKAVSVLNLISYPLRPFFSIKVLPTIEAPEGKCALTPPYLDVSRAIATVVQYKPRITAPTVRAGSTARIVF